MGIVGTCLCRLGDRELVGSQLPDRALSLPISDAGGLRI